MSDDIELKSGIVVPASAANQGDILQQRIDAAIRERAAQIAEWARSWERAGQKPLQRIDIQQACMVHAQIHLWPPDYMIKVQLEACLLLGLIKPEVQQPDNRQRRRASERRTTGDRPALKSVGGPALDPQGDGNPLVYSPRIRTEEPGP